MHFEKLYIRQSAQDLFLDLEKLFKGSKEYYFRDQILNATLSISNNIAEGAERETNKEKIRFLYIARGSCGEVRSMLYLLKRKNNIDEKTFQEFKGVTIQISLGITKYIQKLSS